MRGESWAGVLAEFRQSGQVGQVHGGLPLMIEHFVIFSSPRITDNSSGCADLVGFNEIANGGRRCRTSIDM
jgi:hypothetical protein